MSNYEAHDINRIIENKVICDLSNTHQFLNKNGFEKILEIKLPITIYQQKNNNNSKLMIRFCDDIKINSKFELDEKIQNILPRQLFKSDFFDIKKFKIGTDSLMKFALNIDGSIIEKLLSGYNKSKTKKEKEIVEEFLTAHEIGLQRYDIKTGLEGHLIHSFHPEKMDYFYTRPDLYFPYIWELDDWKKNTISPYISKRWHEIRVLVNEKSLIKQYEENENIKNLLNIIEKNSWKERKEKKFGNEIEKILNFLLEKTSYNLKLLKKILELGKIIGVVYLDVWLQFLLYDLANGIPPEEIENESSFLLKVKEDYDESKNKNSLRINKIVNNDYHKQEISMHEVISIDYNKINRSWYVYKPNDYENSLSILKGKIFFRELFNTMKKYNAPPFADGIKKHRYIIINYHYPNLNPYLLLIDKKISWKKFQHIDKYMFNFDSDKYYKFYFEKSLDCMRKIGFKNPNEIYTWISPKSN